MSVSSQVEWGKLLEAAELITQVACAMGAARTQRTLTVRELLDEFQTAKARAGRSERYLRQVRVSVRGVLGACLARPIATLTTGDVEAGHSEQMLFAHYRELVTKEAAAEFWAIVP